MGLAGQHTHGCAPLGRQGQEPVQLAHGFRTDAQFAAERCGLGGRRREARTSAWLSPRARVQMHWPADDSTTVQDYWPVFLDLVAAGKVRAVGLSNHSIAQLETAEALGHVHSVQPPLNLIHREAAADATPWCAAHGTGVIVYSPMASGLLTASFTAERAATQEEGDCRRASPDFTGDRLRRNLDLVEALSPTAERHAVSVQSSPHRLDAVLPGRHRGDRRCPPPRSGRRLAAGEHAYAERG